MNIRIHQFIFFIGLMLMMTLWPAPGTLTAAESLSQPVKGMVWEPSSALEDTDAARDWQRMATLGIEAVRVPADRIDEARHLALADTLGLQLFVDLPFSGLTSGSMAQVVPDAHEWLARVLAWAEQHPSVRHIGLAQESDTGARSVCEALRQLAGEAHQQGPADLQIYYTTPLTDHDRCANAVDLVLLETWGTDPIKKIDAWSTAHGAQNIGLANLGQRVAPDATDGFHHPRSPVSQARFFETYLDTLLREPAAPLEAIFVHQWRDVVDNDSAVAGKPVASCCFGLHTADHEPRPALEVVAGFYSGEETVFSFPAGASAGAPTPWILLAGWLALALLGASFASSLLVRRLVPRYVMAPGFYRESLREGRELPRQMTFSLLGITALASGTIGAAVFQILHREAALLWLLSQLSMRARHTLLSLLDHVWPLILLLTVFVAVGIVLWAGLIILLSMRKRRLTPVQSLTLVLWPRWPVFLLLVGAMLLTTLPPQEARTGVFLLIGLWGILLLVRTVRVANDTRRVVRLSGGVQMVLLSPLALLLALILLSIALFHSEILFAWRLLMDG